MQYLLLIYSNERRWAEMSDAEQQAEGMKYMAFSRSIRESGHYIGGEALQPSLTATQVTRKGGKVITTDGPFAETKEQLGGYYLVEAKDLDEATEIASRIPAVEHGSTIEVRPIMPTPKDF